MGVWREGQDKAEFVETILGDETEEDGTSSLRVAIAIALADAGDGDGDGADATSFAAGLAGISSSTAAGG